MKQLTGLCIAILGSLGCFAQSSLPVPAVTMGMTVPVLRQPASIQVLVTNPSFAPVPTGDVTIDFGDGSDPADLTLSETRVEVSHAYATAGKFTITASYGGDTNFAPAVTSMTTVSVTSAPVYQLTLFGDSLTGVLVDNWPAMLTKALGWNWKAYSCGGCKTNDQAPYVYNFTVDGTAASTWMLGQNDSPGSAAMLAQYQAAALAQNAWLAIPEGPAKLRAQSTAVQQTGSWTTSDVYATTGLRSSVPGSSLTAKLTGNAIYVGLTSLKTTDSTVDVIIDGMDQGLVSPVEVYAGRYQNADSYGLRYALGGDLTASHTVEIVCTDPGASGCYVDWMGSNGAALRPNLPPYVWTAVSYRTQKEANSPDVDPRANAVRTVESQLQSDGLAIRLADMEAVFSGSALPDCAGDGTHPVTCGNQIEETVWLSAMNFLATEAQRIDVGTITPAVVGEPLTLDLASATSGLPVTYSIVSGPGVLSSGTFTAQQAGTAVIEADQAGDATELPAAPAQFSIPVRGPTTTTLSSSAASVYVGTSVTLTAIVAATGATPGNATVTFYDGLSVLGSAPLNAGAQAQLSVTLPVGTHSLSATLAQTSTLTASTSDSVTVTVLPPPPDFTLGATPDALTLKRGTAGAATVLLTPQNGFNATVALDCTDSPADTTCSVSAPVTGTNGTLSYVVTVSASTRSAARRASFPLWALMPLGLIFWRRRRGVTPWLSVLLVAGLLIGLTGCVASEPPRESGTVTVTATATTGQSHRTQIALTLD